MDWGNRVRGVEEGVQGRIRDALRDTIEEARKKRLEYEEEQRVYMEYIRK